ncbi:MAG TPA: sortase [Candidatus Saccharimonadales bacterium]|nr:sortase [Candidatus Saccharimonadales bacterium]
MIQPLFPQDDNPQNAPKQDENYLLKHRHARKIQPISKDLFAPAMVAAAPANHPHNNQAADDTPAEPAVDLIRRKVEAIYSQEPSATEEITQTYAPEAPLRSRHQQFMHELSTSGKSLAQIQTAWHNYYVTLPDDEKHVVWQEFYAANNRQPSAYTQYATQQAAQAPQPVTMPHMPQLPRMPKQTVEADSAPATTMTHQAAIAGETTTARKRDRRSAKGVKKDILKHVRASEKTKAKAKAHFQSLAFGLVTGGVVLLVFFFSFFNEMIIAPFIQPSRTVSATPIIVDSDSVAPSAVPEVIIPKINVQIPVVYDVTSMAEADIQEGLERGVVHYPTTVVPGQQGNAAIFGHSSNNIFNKGKYKFAFALLRQLEPGDVFYLTYDQKVYSYRVFAKKVVAPSEVSVLNPVEGKPVTAALITCDPPGTSTNRLVVWGEQISPDPAAATAAVTPPTPADDTPVELPSEGPTLWSRMWNSIF